MSLFSPQCIVSAVLCICLTLTLPSTIPLYYRRLRGVTPAWTAYVPPQGAAAACSGSSSAAGCSHCCSAEGHARQTMMMEGRTNNYATYQTCPEISGNTSTINRTEVAINDFAESVERFNKLLQESCANILVNTSHQQMRLYDRSSLCGQLKRPPHHRIGNFILLKYHN